MRFANALGERLRLILGFVLCLLSGTWAHAPALAADDIYCAEYGATALAQQQQQVRQGCGFGPPVWSNNLNHHVAWCRKVQQGQAEAGTRQRVAELKRCMGPSAPVIGEDPNCTRYAVLAVRQQAENQRLGCNLRGPQWNDDASYHYAWCVRVPQSLSDAGRRARTQAMGRCESGAASGQGIAVVKHADKRVVLSRSALVQGAEALQLDKDRDGLVDMAENLLADAVRPMLAFDSDERHRRANGPLALFQALPVPAPPGTSGIRIVFALVFASDAYGPAAGTGCNLKSGSHPGDIEDLVVDLHGDPSGRDWRMVRVALARWRPGPSWPGTALQIHDRTHPVVYLSASKHHQYLDTSHDHRDSRYSDGWWILDKCNDDVNGRGARFLADVKSLGSRNAYGFNNVGEHLDHSPPFFTDDLAPFYPGKRVWDGQRFFEASAFVNVFERKGNGGIGEFSLLYPHLTPNDRIMIVKFGYSVGSSAVGGGPLHAGAWLIGDKGIKLNSYKPTLAPGKSGYAKVAMVLPKDELLATRVQLFLMQNGAVVMERTFPIHVRLPQVR